MGPFPPIHSVGAGKRMVTSNPEFDLVCWLLVASYGIGALIAIGQLARLNKRDEGTLCSTGCFLPTTVQQFVHLIILILCSVRVAFFVCAIKSWDPYLGQIVNSKVEFYSLDEFSSALFFSLTSILALFWAELYYISIYRADLFIWYVRPATNIFIMIAFAAVSVCSWLVSKSYATDVDYVFLQYTVLITVIYLLAAMMFAYYASVAAAELNIVPIVLSARINRLTSLRLLAVICISSLILKAGTLIYLNGREIETVSPIMLVAVFMYYFCCELFPTCVILVFYRVGPLLRSHQDKEDMSGGERNAGNEGEEGRVVNGKHSSRTLRSISPIRAAGGGATNPEGWYSFVCYLFCDDD